MSIQEFKNDDLGRLKLEGYLVQWWAALANYDLAVADYDPRFPSNALTSAKKSLDFHERQCSEVWGAAMWDVLVSLREPDEPNGLFFDKWEKQCCDVYFNSSKPATEVSNVELPGNL